MKKIHTLLLTLIILILLLITLSFIKIGKQQVVTLADKTSSTDETIKVIDLTTNDIKEITITDSTESLTYIPKGEEWSIQGYDHLLLDFEKLNNTGKSLIHIEASRQINASTLKDFQLDEPSQTITYTLNDGKVIELLVGTKTPDATSCYVKINTPDSPIYLVSSLTSDSFTSHINDLRVTQLETYDATHVTGLTITGPGIDSMQIALAKEQASLMANYTLTTQTLNQVSVDSTAFNELVTHLPDIKISDFIADHVTDLSPYGLDHPILHLIKELTETDATTQKSSTRTLDYIWGNKLSNGKITFMKTGDQSVYAMDNSFLEPLLKDLDPFKLSSKWIGLMSIKNVKSIDLNLPSGNYRLAIDQDTYTINDKVVTEECFKKVYSALIDIKADHLVPEGTITPQDTPQLYFIYNLKDGSTKSINFYQYNDQFVLTTLNNVMTVNCSLKQFTHVEELLSTALSNLQ